MLHKLVLEDKVFNRTKEAVVRTITEDVDLDDNGKVELINMINDKYGLIIDSIYNRYMELYNGSDSTVNKYDKYIYVFIKNMLSLTYYFDETSDVTMLSNDIVRCADSDLILRSRNSIYCKRVNCKRIIGNIYAPSEAHFERVWYGAIGNDRGIMKKLIFENELLTFTELINCIIKLDLPLIQEKPIGSYNKIINKNIWHFYDLIVNIKDKNKIVSLVNKVNETNNFEEIQNMLKEDYNLLVYPVDEDGKKIKSIINKTNELIQ